MKKKKSIHLSKAPGAGPLITLMTDFGEADAFVGTMKGVILNIVPLARLVDLSHLVPPQDVKQAAFILMTAVPFFPDGCVHLVVVDPGVGSRRRPIAVKTSRSQFVAPDNGVLSYALAGEPSYVVHELANPAYRLPEVSNTFHGRDIFSPAAAHLANGVPIEELGPKVDDLVLLDLPRLSIHDDRIEAEVIRVDHFGNVRTSMHLFTWQDDGALLLRPMFRPDAGPAGGLRFDAGHASVEVGPLKIEGISSTFAEVDPGQPLALIGSEGGLEIAVNQGNAARQFDIHTGDPVWVHLGG